MHQDLFVLKGIVKCRGILSTRDEHEKLNRPDFLIKKKNLKKKNKRNNNTNKWNGFKIINSSRAQQF